jgi:hypothetical protein
MMLVIVVMATAASVMVLAMASASQVCSGTVVIAYANGDRPPPLSSICKDHDHMAIDPAR